MTTDLVYYQDPYKKRQKQLWLRLRRALGAC